MSDYNLTLFEACELLNRSKKSISRYIRRGLLHPQQIKSQQGTLEYRFSENDLKAFKEKETERRQDTADRTDRTPDTKEATNQTLEKAKKTLDKSNTEQTGQRRQDRTEETGQREKESIIKEESILNKATTEETGHPQPDQTGQDNKVIDLLKETTGLLKNQLKVKDEQIKDLGGKIDQLIERDRETNILLKGLQEKILMLEKPKEPTTKKKQAKQEPKKPDQTGQKEGIKKGFWQGFFK